MSSFRLRAFGGIVPRLAAHLLQENQAAVAINVRLRDGNLTPLRAPLSVASLGISGVRTVFRMRSGANDYWLAWTRDVSVARGPIAGDTSQRIYWTGDGEPRVSNLSLITTGGPPYPQAWYVLGAFPPATAPGVSHAGGVGAAVSRAFRYTFVAVWPDGSTEESQPSPASASTAGKVDGTWTITGMDTAPPNSYTVTAASWAAGVLTLTCANTFGLRAGEEVALTGFAPAALNATFAVASVGAPGFTVPMSADPGTITDGVGTATRKAPHNTGSMVKRLYWSEAGEYVLVQDSIPVANTGTTVAGNASALGALLSTDWAMPPTDLKALVLHPSGFMIGISKNQVCFSEPLRPYAWPTKYRKTLGSNGVGIGLWGSSALIATEGPPEMIAGNLPDSISKTTASQSWPCNSARGVCKVGDGALYPSAAGFIFGGPSGVSVASQEFYTQRDFESVNPDTIIAAVHDGAYYALYDTDEGGKRILIFKPSEQAALIEANYAITGLYGDDQNGELYCISVGATGDKVSKWDADDGLKLSMDWMSKEFWFNEPLNPAMAKIDANWEMSAEELAAAQASYSAALAANAALVAGACGGSLNDDEMNAVRLAGSLIDDLPPIAFDTVQFTLYVDGNAKFSKVVHDSKAFRLPSGYKASRFAVRLAGNVAIKSVGVASSALGLKEV